MKAIYLMSLLIPLASAQSLTDRFFDEYYFPFNPTTATAAGIHKYDGQLEDYSKAGVDARVAKLKQFEAEFAKLPAEPDRDLVLNSIHANLLELETVRSWERNPDIYSSGISSSAFVIMSRTFAPPEARLRSLIDRERKMPQVLAAARANLKNPPKIYTEIAIQQVPGIVSFFQKDVPLAFKSVTDAKLLAEFRTANDAVIKALGGLPNLSENGCPAALERRFPPGCGNLREETAVRRNGGYSARPAARRSVTPTCARIKRSIAKPGC